MCFFSPKAAVNKPNSHRRTMVVLLSAVFQETRRKGLHTEGTVARCNEWGVTGPLWGDQSGAPVLRMCFAAVL